MDFGAAKTVGQHLRTPAIKTRKSRNEETRNSMPITGEKCGKNSLSIESPKIKTNKNSKVIFEGYNLKNQETSRETTGDEELIIHVEES